MESLADKVENNDADEAPSVAGYFAYNSIELPKDRQVAYILSQSQQLKDDEPVYFREKIHGCNMCFIFNVKENTLQIGKRNEPMTKCFPFDLDPVLFEKQITVSFFTNNVVKIFQDNIKQFKELFLILKADYPQAETIYLFGELFGGQYNKKTDWSLIQSEIRYSDSPQFWLFDIYINKEPIVEERFQFYTKSIPGIKVAPLLFTMKLSEVFDRENKTLKYQYTDFITTIPKLLGIQEEIKDNYAEGVVLKCGKDILLKVKSNKFSETKPQKKKEEKKVKKEDKLEGFNKKITFPRLQNVMTKEGNQLSWEQCYDKLVVDIKEELIKEQALPEDFDNEIKNNEKQLKVKIQKMYENYINKLKK